VLITQSNCCEVFYLPRSSASILQAFAKVPYPLNKPHSVSGHQSGLLAGLNLSSSLSPACFGTVDVVGSAIGGPWTFTYAVSTMPTRALASGLAASSIKFVNRALGLIPLLVASAMRSLWIRGSRSMRGFLSDVIRG
jgi:hypothetical protein